MADAGRHRSPPEAESQTSSTTSNKRGREDGATDTESEGEPETQMSEKSMDGQLTCAVCLSLLSNPFTVIPCLHTFDRSCLVEWWESNANCPLCKQRSQSAKHAFQLSNIISHYHRRSSAKKRVPGPDEDSREEIFPYGRRAPVHQPLPPESSYGGTQSQGRLLFLGGFDSQYGEEENADDSQHSDDDPDPVDEPMPGGNLIWPCASCDPNNNTGYVCPAPIPHPTPEAIAQEQDAAGPNRRPVRAPRRGEERPHILVARGAAVPGAEEHESCTSCNIYLPKNWNADKLKCSECHAYYCTNYDPDGCPKERGLRPRNNLSLANMGVETLWDHMPPFLKLNTHERDVFTNYVRDQLNFTVDQVFEQLADLKLDEERREIQEEYGDADIDDSIRNTPDARWGAGVWLCPNGIYLLISEQLFPWWKAERAKNLVPPAIVSLPDCWYGRDCRTQTHRASHAESYNHICENTAAERGRA